VAFVVYGLSPHHRDEWTRDVKAKELRVADCLFACHVRQPLHRCALVVRREMRVLAGNSRALVPYNFACDKVRSAGCLQHRHRTVTQTVERNLTWLPRLVAPLVGGLMVARQRFYKSCLSENFPKLIRQRSGALVRRRVWKNKSVRVVARSQRGQVIAERWHGVRKTPETLKHRFPGREQAATAMSPKNLCR